MRWGYDYRHESMPVASIILFFAVVGVATAHTIAFVFAAAIAAEQIYRMLSFRHRPTGSILGFPVRPFVRKFL